MNNPEVLAEQLATDPDFQTLVRERQRQNDFNIFRVVGQTRMELCHSTFLAWLLDPRGSHGQQGVILLSLFQDLLGMDAADAPNRQYCDAARVQPEWSDSEGRIDIVIEVRDALTAVVIEYKVDALEREGQLTGYDQMEICRRQGWRVIKLFVTPDSRPAKGGSNWRAVGFEQLAKWLKESMDKWHGLSAAVKMVMVHFENELARIASARLRPTDACKLLNQRFGSANLNSIAESDGALAKLNSIGDARTVNEVLTEIRRASGPIRLDGVQSRVRDEIRYWVGDPEAMVETSPKQQTKAWCRVVPRSWLKGLPAIGDASFGKANTIRRDLSAWLLIEVWENQHQQWFTALIVAKTTDSDMSKKLEQHLRKLGLTTGSKGPGWQKFELQRVYDAEKSGRDVEACVSAIEASVRSLVAKLATLPSELRELFGRS